MMLSADEREVKWIPNQNPTGIWTQDLLITIVKHSYQLKAEESKTNPTLNKNHDNTDEHGWSLNKQRSCKDISTGAACWVAE